MLKLIALLLSVTVFITGTMHAQTAASTNQGAAKLRDVIAKHSEEIKNESAAVNPEKLEKIERQPPQTPNKSWNGRRTLIIVTLAALVGLAVVLALTTKRCVKRSPEGCNFVDDANCKCLEYAE